MPLKYINKLRGKRVVVVGGTSGIGFAVAEAAVEYGALVVVASSRSEKVKRAVERIQAAYPDAGDRIQGKTVDLSAGNVEEQIVALFDFATQQGKYKLDHVVDTAGEGFQMISLDQATPEKVIAPYKVRVVGKVMLAKVAQTYLNISPSSSLVLTSGVSDSKPTPGWAVMAPVGSAQKGLARALANDMKPVRVVCVCPGAVQTELFDNFSPEQRQRVIDLYTSKSLTGTIGTPEELAECYLDAMKNSFMTGVELYADGGYLLA